MLGRFLQPDPEGWDQLGSAVLGTRGQQCHTQGHPRGQHTAQGDPKVPPPSPDLPSTSCTEAEQSRAGKIP